MHLSLICMHPSTLVSVHKTINCCINFIEVTKTVLAFTIRLLLTFYWLRAIKCFLNMNVYVTQSWKPASIIASTTTSTEQWLPLAHSNWRTFTKYSLKITKLRDLHLLHETGDLQMSAFLHSQPRKQALPAWHQEVSFPVRHCVKMMVRNFLLNSKDRRIFKLERKAWVSQAPMDFSRTDKT